jgi:hypothetical protein
MMALHRFTSEVSDKLFHLPSLGVKHFPFNVGLFNWTVPSSTFALLSILSLLPYRQDAQVSEGGPIYSIEVGRFTALPQF